MGYTTVQFLGENYEVSEAVKQYLIYEKTFSKLTTKLINDVTEIIDSHSLCSPSNVINICFESDINKFNKIMDDFTDEFVKKLVSYGIYDVNAADLTNNWEHKGMLQGLCNLTTLKGIQEGKRIIELKELGMAYAYNYAANTITGTGFGIITNSFSTLVIYSAIENYAVLSQAKKADAEYNRVVIALTEKASNTFEIMCKDILINEHYPTLYVVFSQFVSYVTSTFLAYMAADNKFDFESIKEYNMEKANEMLKNINSAPNKIDFLKHIFLKCPFNPDLYDKCLDLGLLDAETLKTAQYFDAIEDSLTDKIENQCRNVIDDKELFKRSLELYMAYFDLTQQDALKKLFSSIIDEIKSKYSYLYKAIAEEYYLIMWIKDNIATSCKKICEYSKSQIEDTIRKYIGGIISQKRQDVLNEYNLLSELELPSGIVLSELNEDLSVKLIERVIEYIDKARTRREELLSEYSELKNEYDTLQSSINSQIYELQKKLDTLKINRNSLGIFAFSKKKELNFQISEISNKIALLKNSDELKELEKKCYQKLQSASEF